MTPARVQAVNHVHLDVPPGAAEAMRAFYVDLLGMPLLDRRDAPDVELCFGANRLQMRLVVRERPDVRPNRRRLTLAIESLDEQVKSFDEAGVRHKRYRGIWFTESRLLVHDPVGHLLELRQAWPLK